MSNRLVMQYMLVSGTVFIGEVDPDEVEAAGANMDAGFSLYKPRVTQRVRSSTDPNATEPVFGVLAGFNPEEIDVYFHAVAISSKPDAETERAYRESTSGLDLSAMGKGSVSPIRPVS